MACISPAQVCNFSLNFSSSNSYRNHKVNMFKIQLFISPLGCFSYTACYPSEWHFHASSCRNKTPAPLQTTLSSSLARITAVYTESHSTQKVPSKGRVGHISHPTIKIFQWLSILLNKDQILQHGLEGSAWCSHSDISTLLYQGPFQPLPSLIILLPVPLELIIQ